MLTHLHIKDFALVDQLDIELQQGLTTITGETGAGKSIMLDALGLALGDKTDADKIRIDCEKADIHASFEVSRLSFVKSWLEEHDLEQGDECILRRVITRQGRSRAYINGHTVTLQQLRALGDKLIDIHNQHEHQSLLNNATHRRLVDEFAGTQTLAKQVKHAFNEWKTLTDTLNQRQNQSDELNARYQLLRYQVQELDQLALEPGEIEALEKEQSRLSNLGSLQQNCQHVIELCSSDNEGLRDRLNQAVGLIEELPDKADELIQIETMLRNAAIGIEEASSDVERYLQGLDDNPESLIDIEQRLSASYDIARKHRVPPEKLVEHHLSLAEELQGLQSGDDQIEALNQQCEEARARYDKDAQKLSNKRKSAAAKLAKEVNKKLKDLAMERAEFSISLKAIDAEAAAYGNETIAFMISTNPGQPPKPLVKVASGGELSRISLAIQVVTAQTSTTPSLVFDEVDVGIGGTTGDVVGRMLRELGEKGQVFCVTHLAQVASKAHHHLRVEKSASKKSAKSSLTPLSEKDKVGEIARMMGGTVDSEQSLAHAKEMMQSA